MNTTRSDTRENTTTSHKTAVREYLRDHGEVASKNALRAGTDVSAWYIDQTAAKDAFYTSLNHNGEYVASKYVVGHRSTHDGFWRPEVDDGIAVFHRNEDTKPTLKHLAFKRPSGFTPAKANDLLGRRCYRPLQQLAEHGEIHAADWHGTTVYTHSWPSRRDAQLAQRETDQPTDVTPDDPAEDGYLYRDELIATFLSVAVSQIQSISPERAATLVLRQFEGDSFDALERRLRRNYSFREALIIMAAISLLMSRVIVDELQKLDAKQCESADDAGASSPLPRRRCSHAVERHAHLIQLYVMLDLGYDLPALDELLLWASRDPNPHRPRLREQVESGEFW